MHVSSRAREADTAARRAVCWDWRAERDEGGGGLVVLVGVEVEVEVVVVVVVVVVGSGVRAGADLMRGDLKGDLKGWERAFVDGALEVKDEEVVPRRRRLGRGVEDMFSPTPPFFCEEQGLLVGGFKHGFVLLQGWLGT